MSISFTKGTVSRIITLIKKYKDNKDIEFECRFFNNKKTTFDKNVFDKIGYYLTGNKANGNLGLRSKMVTSLDIQDAVTRKRISITGENNVKKYWEFEGIDEIEDEHIESIQKILKENVDMYEFGVRFAVNEEKKTKDVDDILNSSNTKVFRLKNRYEIFSEDGSIRYDLTQVRQYKGKSFKKINPDKLNRLYEIEMEIIDANKFDQMKAVKDVLLKNIYTILRIIYNNNNVLEKTKINSIINNYNKCIDQNNKKKDRFIAANPVTIQIENLEKNSYINNIYNNYAVTLKADGERRLLYIDRDDGEVYLIDINFNIYKINMNMKGWIDTIIECEYVKEGKLLLLYDILFYKGKDVRLNQLKTAVGKMSEKKGRLDYLNDFVKANKKDKRISLKKYYFSKLKDGSDIFERTSECWDSRKAQVFHVDGLIFVPIKEHYPLHSGAWYSLFKWKPAHLNSIDFLVRTIKDETETDAINADIRNILRPDGTLQKLNCQFKTLKLFVGGKKQTSNNNKISLKLAPMEFNPKKNKHYDYSRAFVTIDSKNKMFAMDPLTGQKNEIYDDTIVEFGYDLSKEGSFRWVPYRVRYDKTQSYKEGKPVYGNYEKTANSIFFSLEYPVTEDMILTGKVPEKVLTNYKNSKTKQNNNMNNYYANQNYDPNARKSYQLFHNLYVKEKLLQDVSPAMLNGSNKRYGRLLDIGSGKGGDIKKWKRAKLGEVFGIELDVQNIEYARNLFNKIPKPKPRVVYLIGNCSRLIFPDYDAGPSESNRINLKKYLPAQHTFDVVGIQFALHYFFENEITFRTILQNVTDNCKIGGYFIGTCFDGVRLFKALKGKKKISGTDESGQVIWSIDKEYKTTRFNANKNSLGREVKVFVKSIGNYHTEYLVNFDYLDKMLEDYGFEKVRVTPFSEEYENMMKENYSNNKNMMNIQNIDEKIGDSEKEFSFLNNAFVYKKVKNAPEKERMALLKLMKKQETKEAKKEVVVDKGVEVVNKSTEKLIEDEEEQAEDSDESDNDSDEEQVEDSDESDNDSDEEQVEDEEQVKDSPEGDNDSDEEIDLDELSNSDEEGEEGDDEESESENESSDNDSN